MKNLAACRLFKYKVASYRYGISHYEDKTVVRPSYEDKKVVRSYYLYNENICTWQDNLYIETDFKSEHGHQTSDSDHIDELAWEKIEFSADA